MKNLTDEQILDALECWLDPNNCKVECKNCPLHEPTLHTCREETLKAAKDRILNSRKEKNNEKARSN